LFPGANPNSVLLVWDYCLARKLDPLKKPCHIVPMEVKDAKTGTYEWRGPSAGFRVGSVPGQTKRPALRARATR
jgi:hypothetical protein